MSFLNIRLLMIVLIAFVGFSSPLLAAPSQSVFDNGAKAFNRGDYSAAVNYFKKAEEQGMKSPSLYYNLASSYYKLAQYENAKTYFNKVRQYKKMQSLAEYNLGLIALKANDKASAKKMFSNVSANSNDKKLAALSQKNLKRMQTKPRQNWLTKKWSVYVSGALGYDDNVNFAPLGIANEVSSRFSEVSASVDYLFSGDRRNGWLADAYFYSIKYYDVESPTLGLTNIYDEYEYGAGIKKAIKLNKDWQTNYALNMSKINYAGEDYQSIIKLSAQAKNNLSRNERLYFRYAYEDIKSDKDIFDYLEGWRQKLRAEYRLYRKQDNARIYYELELNNRNDLSLASGLYSYSPTRHTIRGRYTSILSREWRLIGDLAYRASDYPVTASQDRQDDRLRAAAYADYRITRDIKFRAKVDYTDNRSTEEIFAYKRTVYSLGLSAIF